MVLNYAKWKTSAKLQSINADQKILQADLLSENYCYILYLNLPFLYTLHNKPILGFGQCGTGKLCISKLWTKFSLLNQVVIIITLKFYSNTRYITEKVPMRYIAHNNIRRQPYWAWQLESHLHWLCSPPMYFHLSKPAHWKSAVVDPKDSYPFLVSLRCFSSQPLSDKKATVSITWHNYKCQ